MRWTAHLWGVGGQWRGHRWHFTAPTFAHKPTGFLHPLLAGDARHNWSKISHRYGFLGDFGLVKGLLEYCNNSSVTAGEEDKAGLIVTQQIRTQIPCTAHRLRSRHGELQGCELELLSCKIKHAWLHHPWARPVALALCSSITKQIIAAENSTYTCPSTSSLLVLIWLWPSDIHTHTPFAFFGKVIYFSHWSSVLKTNTEMEKTQQANTHNTSTHCAINTGSRLAWGWVSCFLVFAHYTFIKVNKNCLWLPYKTVHRVAESRTGLSARHFHFLPYKSKETVP